MKEFWNERYATDEFAYGTEPNTFIKENLPNFTPGKILFPAEGEGRNAVYAAQLGWDVSAFDISEQGKKKAQMLAAEKKMEIDYSVQSVENCTFPLESFDAIALVFAHFPADIRRVSHRQLAEYLKPGGVLLLEGFTKKQLEYSKANPKSGGPKNEAMLFSIDEIKSDFEHFDFKLLTETETNMDEGLYHIGKSHVLRMIAVKKQVAG